MAFTKKAYHPSGEVIYFDDKYHKYYTDKRDSFTSCTSLIHNFFPKFDTETISKRYAAKHGLTQKEVLASWDKARNDGCELGTGVHDFVENKLTGGMVVPAKSDKESAMRVHAAKAADWLTWRYDLLEVEKIIYSNDYGVAGMADLIMRDGDTIYILDWKTNKELKYNNRFQSGLDPIGDLEDCNYVHYTLQLNIYRHLLEKEGYYPDVSKYVMQLIYLTVDGYEFIPIEDQQFNAHKILKRNKENELQEKK